MEQVTLKGAFSSPYALKMRAVLRYRRIPHRWVLRGSQCLVWLREAHDRPGDRSLRGRRDSMISAEWRGQRIATDAMPCRFGLRQRLHDDLAAAAPAAQKGVREVFAVAGLETILDLRTLRRVERNDHLGLWGPVVDG